MELHHSTGAGIGEILSRALGNEVHVHRTSPHTPASHTPPVDVKDAGSEFVIYVDLPGIDEDSAEFAWEGSAFTVSGNRDFDHDSEDAEEFIQLESPYGPYVCRVEFDVPIDPDQATAKYKRGVLKVRLPKLDRRSAE